MNIVCLYQGLFEPSQAMAPKIYTLLYLMGGSSLVLLVLLFGSGGEENGSSVSSLCNSVSAEIKILLVI